MGAARVVFTRIALVTVLLVLAASGCGRGVADRSANQIDVTQAWGDYTGTMLSAYMKITNRGATADAVVGATAPGIGRAMLHLSKVNRDMMQMEHVERIELPPRETVELKPGGYHVMVEIKDVRRTFHRGDRWPLILRLASGAEVRVDVEVK